MQTVLQQLTSSFLVVAAQTSLVPSVTTNELITKNSDSHMNSVKHKLRYKTQQSLQICMCNVTQSHHRRALEFHI